MKILIAAGGTGGHIYPGLAIADKIKEKMPEAQITFIGSMVGMEKNIIPQTGYPIEYINVRGFERSLSLETIVAFKGIFDGIRDSKRVLKRHNPDLVIGTGGFTCGPLLLEASRKKISTMIHEQNAFPGRANRLLGKKVDRIGISFDEAKKYFPEERTFLAGNPVRSEYCQIDSQAERKYLGIDESQKMVLIMGGSQGAGSINEATLELMKAWKGNKNRIVYHLTGKNQFLEIQERMKKEGIDQEENLIIEAYSNEVYRLLGAADLVISRAGAMSVAEIAAAGKPSILVPYPLAAGNHQDFNAKVITDNGGGILLEDKMITGEILVETVNTLINDEDTLKIMSQNTDKVKILDASERIYSEIKELLEKK
ncbi:MAG: undecaprenyldiphospho-muramoylpentapeptide beta-N-acetylglucosaminyltransferase [Eubacteriaceae bacterium]